MQILTITITLAVIALALGTTTITTTIQIQPAYSQATHCRDVFGTTSCVTPGKIPTIDGIPIAGDQPHQDAGRQIGGCHKTDAQTGGLVGCTVTQP